MAERLTKVRAAAVDNLGSEHQSKASLPRRGSRAAAQRQNDVGGGPVWLLSRRSPGCLRAELATN